MRRKRGGLNFNRKRKKFNFKKFQEVISWIFSIAIVILLAYVSVTYFGKRTTVVGNAMSPTLQSDEQVWVNQLAYAFGKPKAGDVVVFLPNGNEKSHFYIRRVVGCPGDSVQIVDGALYINGELYNEKIDVAAMEDAGLVDEVMILENNEYFVLGDNRNSSEDSRHANIGNVKKEYIVGKPWFHYESISNFGFIK